MADYFPKRLRYYNGQFLLSADLRDEQESHRNRQMLHDRMAHFWGITEGLAVTPGAAPQSLEIGPGAALDRDGNLILLDADATKSFQGVGAGTWYLVIQFHEEESDPAAAKYVPGNTRFTQVPVFAFKGAGALVPGDVILAAVALAGAVQLESLVSLDPSVRTYAGLRVNGPNDDGFDLRTKADGTLLLERYLAGDASLTPILHVPAAGGLGVGAAPPSGTLLAVGANNELRVSAAGAVAASSLDVGSGAIGGGAITGTSLDVGSGAIGGGAITGTSLNAGSVTASTITGQSLSAGATGTVTAQSIGLKGGSGSPTNIIAVGAGTPVFKVTDTGAITGASLSVGSGSIGGGAITGTSLNVGSGTIGGGVITGASLNVGSGPLNGGVITGTSLNVGAGPVTANSFTVTNGTMSGSLGFGSSTRQMINLWSTGYGIGVQSSTCYLRSDGNFAFYKGGIHSNTELDGGTGGSALLVLRTNGNVGIGHTEPGTKLDVNGAIRGTSLTVGSGSITAGAITGQSLSVGAGSISGGAISASGAVNVSGGLTVNGGGISAPGQTISAGSGDVVARGRSVVVSNSSAQLRVLGGIVRPDGNIDDGSGFTVVKAGTGLYDITFSPGFNNYPAVVATQLYPGFVFGAGGDTRDNAVVLVITPTKCRIKTGDGNGGASDRYFSFMALGT